MNTAPPTFDAPVDRTDVWLAGLCAAVTALVLLAAWGDLSPWPYWHDEAAYVLQSRIFASFAWSAPGPPLPQFFEQTHVLVEPALAAKYPPGHSLVLAVGSLLGSPAAMSIALSALTGAFLFLVIRRLAGRAAAGLSWLIWVLSPATFEWRLSFFSEITTGAIIMISWYLVVSFRHRPRGGPLLLLGGILGLGAITRPLTMLALALPIGFVLLRDLPDRLRPRWLAGAVVVGLLVLGIWPLWSAMTLDGRGSPHAVYTSEYMPWDRMGFGLDETPPARPETREVAGLRAYFAPIHRNHTLSNLPGILRRRVAFFLRETASGWPAALLAALGLLARPRIAGIALASAALLFAAYGLYAHAPNWTIYYLEATPVPAILIAIGIASAVRWLGGTDGSGRRRLRVPSSALLALATVMIVGFRVTPGLAEVRARDERMRPVVAFEECLGQLPDRSGVFVRYDTAGEVHVSLVRNSHEPAAERVLTAHDLGPRNHELVRAIPGRQWYVYDQAGARVRRVGGEAGAWQPCPRRPVAR